jgi:hypothetical protein
LPKDLNYGLYSTFAIGLFLAWARSTAQSLARDAAAALALDARARIERRDRCDLYHSALRDRGTTPVCAH